MKAEGKRGVLLAIAVALAILLFLLLRRASARELREFVTSRILPGGREVEESTGAKLFDSTSRDTIPEGELLPAIRGFNNRPVLTPPEGFDLWKDVATSTYWYVPRGVNP